jgi:uncharacterized membrane protein
MAEGAQAQPPPRAERRAAEVEFSRVVAFTDGVFAIAITLLVLALDVPDSADDLAHSLSNQEADFFAYALSFAVLAKLWLAHHRFVSQIDRFDDRLMGITLFYLAWIALIPFSSELLGDYGGETDAVIVYALNMVAVSLTFAWQMSHAFRAGLVKSEYAGRPRLFTGPAHFSVAAVFAASIPVALVSPTAGTLMWLLLFVVGRWLDRAGAAEDSD